MSVLEEFRDPPHAEPADHRGRDLVADEITENRRMTGMLRHRLAHRSHDLAPVFCPDEELDVLGPRQRDQDAHPGSRAAIEKPARRHDDKCARR